jgi:hypothetical protein
MAFRRGGFALTPPSMIVFAISVILAILALLARYAGVRIPVVSPNHVFDALAIAYLVLLAGVVFRRM